MMWYIGSEVMLSKDHGMIIVRNAIKGGGSMVESF